MNMNIKWNELLVSILDFLQRNAWGLLASLAIIFLVERFIAFLATHYIPNETKRHSVKKWNRYVALIFALLWIVIIYGVHRQKDVFFLLGLFLAGVAIALRDVFSGFIGWLIIISPKGFRHGDRIRLGTVVGDVIDIGLFRTVLAEIGEWVEADQSTGRLVAVPNSMILSQPLYNYTEGYDFIWNEFKVLVTFESNWQRAEDILMEIGQRDFEEQKDQIQERLRRVRKRYLLRYNYITPKVYVKIADSGVLLTLRYMVRARRRRTLEDRVARDVLTRFAKEPAVDFAYPTMRIRGEMREEKG